MSIIPGGHPGLATFTGATLPDIDSLLIDNEGIFIIDNEGNFIDIGGGFEAGDDTSSVTWVPGDQV